MSRPLDHIADIPAYIFGEQSQVALVEPSAAAAQELSQGAPLWFNLSLLLLCAVYIVWLNHWSTRSSNHGALFQFLGYHRGSYPDKEQHITPTMEGYLNSGLVLGVVALSAASIKLFGSSMLSDYRVSLYVLSFFFVLIIYQLLMIKIIGWVASEPKIAKMLLRIKKICCAILTVCITPLILCYAFSGVQNQQLLMYITFSGVAGTVLILLYETFLLFLHKKVSVLHTILYLCAVEIFPFTLIWGFFYR